MRLLKFEPPGRTGVVVGYSELQSYLVLDEHELMHNGEFRIFRTGDVSVFPEVFPMRRMAQAPARPRHVVLGQLLQQPGPTHPSNLLNGRCIVCDGHNSPVVISCPACKGRRRAHGTCGAHSTA